MQRCDRDSIGGIPGPKTEREGAQPSLVTGPVWGLVWGTPRIRKESRTNIEGHCPARTRCSVDGNLGSTTTSESTTLMAINPSHNKPPVPSLWSRCCHETRMTCISAPSFIQARAELKSYISPAYRSGPVELFPSPTCLGSRRASAQNWRSQLNLHYLRH